MADGDTFGDFIDVGGGALCEAGTGDDMTTFAEGLNVDVEGFEVLTVGFEGDDWGATLAPTAGVETMNSLAERRGESGVGETDGDFDL
jgi:hypothetical protein